jgi:hypothetical protein
VYKIRISGVLVQFVGFAKELVAAQQIHQCAGTERCGVVELPIHPGVQEVLGSKPGR